MRNNETAGCIACLRRCEEVFAPAHASLYMEERESGLLYPRAAQPGEIPPHLPQDHAQVRDLAAQGYSAMLDLGLPEEYLSHPDLSAQADHCEALSPEECAQFLLFAFRLPLRYGQQGFFALWRRGVLQTAARRLRVHLEQEN